MVPSNKFYHAQINWHHEYLFKLWLIQYLYKRSYYNQYLMITYCGKDFLGSFMLQAEQFGECSRNQAHNLLVPKITLNYLAKMTSLAKWLNVYFQKKWLSVRIPLQSPEFQITSLFLSKNLLTLGKVQIVDSLKTRIRHDKTTQ